MKQEGGDFVAKEFTRAQHRAVAAIERAFRQANRAGLAVCGMDDELLAYRADDLDDLHEELGDYYDAQRALMSEHETGQTIRTYGAFRDSGGW